MTLAEKILALRTERNLSQGDLAEKLDVSRQSVSKWETGQSVPELDKLIRLADVFGVSVDQLVREGGPPKPAVETPPAAQPQIVYVERPGRCLTAVQILGVVCTAGGALGGSILLMGLLLLLAYGALSVLAILLPILTIRLARQTWKKRAEHAPA